MEKMKKKSLKQQKQGQKQCEVKKLRNEENQIYTPQERYTFKFKKGLIYENTKLKNKQLWQTIK